MSKTFHWLDVQRIGEELADRHPSVDPMSVRFTDLKRLVVELPGFQEEPGHPANERILEEIQRHWLMERQGAERED